MGDTNEATVLPEVKEKLIKLDPYILFREVQTLIAEGMPEETVREAFNQLIQESAGKFRTPQRRITKTDDSAPVMMQADINKMYEDQLKRPEAVVMSEEMELLSKEIERSLAARGTTVTLPVTKPTIRRRIKARFFKVLHFGLTKFLALIVWTFNKAGIK